jgi:hypothetical protein
MASRSCDTCRWCGPPPPDSDPYRGNCDFPLPPMDGAQTDPDDGRDCPVWQIRTQMHDPELAELIRARGDIARLSRENMDMAEALGWSAPPEKGRG